MSLISVLTDWTGARKMKEGLLASLRMTRPGGGITINLVEKPNPDLPGTMIARTETEKRLIHRAIIELLTEHPTSLEATDLGCEITLMRKADAARTIGADAHGKLVDTLGILNGDNLVDSNFGGGATLPAHALRNGVPDSYRGTPDWLRVAEEQEEQQKQARKKLVDARGKEIS